MGKTILFCADGTWNGSRNANEEDGDAVEEGRTNVYKLFANLHAQTPADETAKEQERDLVDAAGRPTGIVKYLHGVGDSGNAVVRILGGTVGAGLVARIVRGYTFVSRNYQPDDDIILIGFSRGAYTARALAGLIAAKGVLRLTSAQWANKDEAYRLGAAVWYDYQAAKQTATRSGWWSYIATGAVSFVLDVQATLTRAPHNNLSVDRIRAVGVWDTVGALGVPIIRNDTRIDVFGFADTMLSPKVVNGFHAIAVDEQRVDFTPSLWTPDPEKPTRIAQMLFPGAHADVGGGYSMPAPAMPARRNECGLSDGALAWMMEQLAGCGVMFALNPPYAPKPDPGAMAHQPWLKIPYVTDPRQFPTAIGLMLHPSIATRAKAGPVGLDPRVQQGMAYGPMNLP